jgi:NTP pyrophosphatase (non-canonical NTP hydrolase)
MTLNELRDEIFNYAEKQGFHEEPFNFGESLMLVVSELSEALEADRNNKWCGNPILMSGKTLLELLPEEVTKTAYNQSVKDTVEEELADAIMRLCALAGHKKIDLDWHVKAKMTYNKNRPYKHGKKYG